MAAAVLDGGLAFLAGYACRAHCSLPCQAKLASSSKPFKLSVVVHSASLNALDGGPGLVQNQRPYVGVCVGDRTKETELGDWSKERGQWCFRETITVLVEASDEISLHASCSTRYDFYVAAVSLNSKSLGHICFPVTAVLQRLRPEDRDADGLVFATPVMGFDVVEEGHVSGRVYLSFETLTPPPSRKETDPDRCCGWSGEGKFRTDDESTAPSDRTSVDYRDGGYGSDNFTISSARTPY
eukprot:TRINITY_DN53950_c0_g1_i1.p1 TRINITY_DN53950_c0_g1~~TRINITY_DN53950_c0_g1_i1.p1  ORF type:complete len:264 (-),score=33.50 TRINITY_DN53950_c0_g1_i1:126-845(-)